MSPTSASSPAVAATPPTPASDTSARGAWFPGRWLPWLLLLPQLLVIAVFFLWPTLRALRDAFYQGDAFGLREHYVGLRHFQYIFTSADYGHAVLRTLAYALLASGLSLLGGFALALAVEGLRAGRTLFRTLLLWPYALAPAISAALWVFLFRPQVGLGAGLLQQLGVHWDPALQAGQAQALVLATTVWQLLAYNFLFYSAALQSLPPSLLEAAALDGARGWRRVRDVIWPLLAPTTLFLLVTDLAFVLFDTFGLIDVLTQGGPYHATESLVYKLYEDGFRNFDQGAAAVQSLLLMLLVTGLGLLQLRWQRRRLKP